MTKNRILPSFQKGLSIIESIAESSSGKRLADLAKEIDMPSSNLSLYINTMINQRIIVRDPGNKKFYTHPRLSQLFSQCTSSFSHQLISASEDSMKNLHERYNENILLGMQKNHDVTVIKYISSTQIMRVGIEPDRYFPLHLTAMGRSILTNLSDDFIERYFNSSKLEKLTNKTKIDKEEICKELKQIKEDGYAFNPGEYESQVMAVAVPIMYKERPVATLAVQFPEMRHSIDEARGASFYIRKEVADIEENLARTVIDD